MNIQAIATGVMIAEFEGAGTVFNGEEKIGLRLVGPEGVFIAYLPNDAAADLSDLIKSSLETGRIV
jgi:hypothetical protein